MADKKPKFSSSNPTSSDIASLLNARLGGAHLTTGEALKPPAPRVPKGEAAFPLAGTREIFPSGEVFVHTEHFEANSHHGVFPLAKLEALTCSGGWPKPATALSSLIFLDTETTGIGGGSYAFLVGVGRWVPGSGFTVAQFFLERGGSECALLEAVNEALCGCAGVVTYNGASFDLPLLTRRCAAHEVEPGHSPLPHLDLLFPARARWKRLTGNAKLTTLEGRLLGYERVDDVPGAQIPGVYRGYEASGFHPAMERVFFHNALDILSLACLYALHVEEGPLGGKAAVKAPKKPTMGAFKKEISALLAEGESARALSLLRERLEKDFSGDPYPFLETAKVLEKAEGDIEGACEVLTRASARTWAPKDREVIEKRLTSLRKKLNT